MTDLTYIRSLRNGTKEDPLRILMSACLAGITCGYDNTANGVYPTALKFFDYDTAKITKFCPEEFSFGTPRQMCDIHGGSGMDVLNGKAKVLSESGLDWTDGMIKASERMLEIARREKIELAVMMDISAACGSTVIYEGNRFAKNKVYQIGAGVAAAQLMRNGFKVISQRDFAALDIVYSKIDPKHVTSDNLLDHYQTAWYKEYFNVTS